jgi:hypothetical protein
MESHEAGFPPFPHSLEIPSGFPHSHGLDDWIYVFSCPLNSNHRHRKGLVTDVSGPQRNACPGTLSPERGLASLFVRMSARDFQARVAAGTGRSGGWRKTRQRRQTGRSETPPSKREALQVAKRILPACNRPRARWTHGEFERMPRLTLSRIEWRSLYPTSTQRSSWETCFKLMKGCHAPREHTFSSPFEKLVP